MSDVQVHGLQVKLREFMQRLSAALHGTLGSYLRDAFQEGTAGAVACLPVPRAKVFSSFLSFSCLVTSTAFSCKKLLIAGKT
jgi:hypothetical protein